MPTGMLRDFLHENAAMTPERFIALWRDNAPMALGRAAAVAYGWTDYTPEMPDEEILRRLLALNLERKAAEGA